MNTEPMNENASESLSLKSVIGECGAKSKAAKERIATHDMAMDAKEHANLDCMFRCYQDAVKSRAKMEKLMFDAMGIMSDKEVDFHASPVEAIRDIALAAISLAEKVASQGVLQTPDSP